MILLFLIYEMSFYLVLGQSETIVHTETVKQSETVSVKTDCTKLNNFINGDSIDYSNNCCVNNDTTQILCDEENYITHLRM